MIKFISSVNILSRFIKFYDALIWFIFRIKLFFHRFPVCLTSKRWFNRCLLLWRCLVLRWVFHQYLRLSQFVVFKVIIFIRDDCTSSFVRSIHVRVSRVCCCLFFKQVIRSSFFFNIHLFSLNDSCSLLYIWRNILASFLFSKVIEPFFLLRVLMLCSAWENVFGRSRLARRTFLVFNRRLKSWRRSKLSVFRRLVSTRIQIF